MKKGCLLLCVLISCAGCSDALLTEMDRLAADPEVVPPRVESFQRELTVSVSWEEDEAADEYVLRRAEDSAGVLSYEILYRGSETHYRDTEVEDEGRYLYTLAKKKGNREFGPSSPVLGVGNDCIGDMWEPNNTKEQAAGLEHELVANSFYYEDAVTHSTVQDTDWYKITIPPRCSASIVVIQSDPIPSQNSSHLSYLVEGTGPAETIASGVLYPLENTGLTTASFLFCIRPRAEECREELTLSGGAVVKYSLRISRIDFL